MDRADARVAVTVREWGPADSLAHLTALLHRAYARLGALGLNYTAVDQSEETTRRRAARGTCLVAEVEGRVVGTLSMHGPDDTGDSPWLTRPDAVLLEQYAVEPDLQGRGIGVALMAEAERRARASGARWLIGDTAEPAEHLVRRYEGLGYRVVDRVRWPGKTYRSVVLAKPLEAP